MKLFIVLVFILSVQIILSQNDAKRNPILTDKFLASAGVFSPFKQVKLGADGSLITTISDDIDFSETFKLEGIQNTFTFNFMWRFSKNKKWSVSGDYFRIGSDNKAVLEEDIEWEDLIFKAGSKIEGGFGLLVVKARSIDVIRRPREIFNEVRKELEKHLTIIDYRILEPYQKDHCMFICKNK